VRITGLPEAGTLIEDEVPPDREFRRHAWLSIIPSLLGLPPHEWVADAVGDDRLSYRDTHAFVHFARDPRHRMEESYTFDLYYDAGTRDQPRDDTPLTALVSGEEYLKLPTDGGVLLSILLALHLASFFVGMLVRYHPGYYWAAVTGKTRGDSIAPLLYACTGDVEEHYPALILEAVGP
jgi:hypothetical protein